MTPWSTSTDLHDGAVCISVLLTTDPGPVREFRPYLDVALDEAHALILFAELGLALQTLSNSRASSNVVAFAPPGHAK